MNASRVREWIVKGDWGLKILSLILAIVIYHVVKIESVRNAYVDLSSHDRTADPAAR